MRIDWMALLVISLPFVVLSGAVALAEPPKELTSACRSDAMRVCSWEALLKAAGGNYKGIDLCFRLHHDALSTPCRSMLTKYGNN
jgi:hypothetical protein